MACVHYGLQQNTKDSDWIIPADALEKLRELLTKREGDLPPWRVSYRQIFGAPLEAEFMQHGWTRHLSIWDNAASVEHKVDIFSKPLRVQAEEIEADNDGWATRHVVAQMKRTDRDKDWPIIQGLGKQLWERKLPTCLLHITDYETLLVAWKAVPAEWREAAAKRRPLLRELEREVLPERLAVERLFALERLVWERVNEQRHGRYTSAWKKFYRQWRREEDWEWPTEDPFWIQHKRLNEAVHRNGLPPNPLAEIPREELVQGALKEVGTVAAATEFEIAKVTPPMEELLP